MPKVIDIRTKMDALQAKMTDAPEWVRNGKRAMDSLPVETQAVIVDFLFGLILSDVQDGLAGEDHESFFEEIDKLYAKANENDHKCFFCDTEDIDTGVCLRCLTKILEIKGRDLDGGKRQDH